MRKDERVHFIWRRHVDTIGDAAIDKRICLFALGIEPSLRDRRHHLSDAVYADFAAMMARRLEQCHDVHATVGVNTRRALVSFWDNGARQTGRLQQIERIFHRRNAVCFQIPTN